MGTSPSLPPRGKMRWPFFSRWRRYLSKTIHENVLGYKTAFYESGMDYLLGMRSRLLKNRTSWRAIG